MELTQNGVHYFGATGTGALWFRLNSLTVSRKLKHHVSKKEVKQHPRQAVTMTKLLQAALSGSVQHGHENLYILLTDWSLPSPPSRPRLRPLALLLHFPHLSDLSVQVELFTYSWCWTITSTQHTQKMKTQPASQPRTAGPCRLPYSCSGIHLTTTRLFFFFFTSISQVYLLKYSCLNGAWKWPAFNWKSSLQAFLDEILKQSIEDSIKGFWTKNMKRVCWNNRMLINVLLVIKYLDR